MKLEDALVKIIADAGLGIEGKTLFHSHMPSEVQKGILVMTRVGITIDAYTGLRKGPFQIIVRDKKIADAHNLATAVLKAMKTDGKTVGVVNFLFIHADHEPLVFPRTEGGQFEASVNYTFAANWE